MISRENYKTIHIRITTFKEAQERNKHQVNMNDERRRSKTNINNKFVCAICLNSNICKPEDEKKDSKTPVTKICMCLEKSRGKHKDDAKLNTAVKRIETGVQTSQVEDVDKSLNLLNEVLTVFQNRKQVEPKQKSKTIILKDASISTDDVRILSKSNLRVSKIFQFSIDESSFDRRNDKFTIITSHEDIKRSQYTVDLSKRKSSSIPQMKLEELKNSMKEKTKSKDAVEEVNRMFATVSKMKRYDIISEDLNRPLVRNGPRILPVVKTKEPRILNTDSDDKSVTPCKCCQTSDCFSSGDSFVKPECCPHNQQEGKCDKCVYTMCCRYKNFRKMQSSVMFCDHCQRENSCNHHKDDFDK